MLGVNLKWFSGKHLPIGIDVGAESLKVLQLTRENDELRILASAREDIPPMVASDPSSRARFITDSLRQMLASRPFKGRRAITCVPAEQFFAQHIRTAKMNEADLAKALPWEANGKLPFPVRDAVLRHLIAGEITSDNETKNEVILMAAPRSAVERQFAAIARAKLEVQTVLVPPLALLEAFAFLFQRSDEQNMCTLFVDIGATQTCAVISQGPKVVFVKQIPVAGQAICSGIATRLDIGRTEAARLRMVMARAEAASARSASEAQAQTMSAAGAEDSSEGGVAVAEPAAAPNDGLTVEQREAIAEATGEQVEKLARELSYCIRYYQSVFPDRPIDRLVFLGGEAHQKRICQQIAKTLRLPAMLGDPMLRMHRTHEGLDCGDLAAGVPAPEWAIAFGCSLTNPETDS